MVRINLINPRNLTDQHLIAEYNEIIMLLSYVRKYKNTSLDKIPKNYTLGKGHILFFKNKLVYLKDRFEKIKEEMQKRGFKTDKKINLSKFPKSLKKNWKPSKKDKEIIKKRIIQKINKKPEFYRYYRVKRERKYLISIIKLAK